MKMWLLSVGLLLAVGPWACGKSSSTTEDAGQDAAQTTDSRTDDQPTDLSPGDAGEDAGSDPGAGDEGQPTDQGGDVESHPCGGGIPSSVNVIDQIRMVIVTGPEMVEAFEVLADWKRQKGVPTEVISTNIISQSFTGEDLPAQIREYVRARRDAGAAYVLLGGDAEVVPPRFVHSKSALAQADDSFASDLYFSDLDGTWDDNQNGTYGDLTDGILFHPEIAVARIPASTPTDVEVFVNHLLFYEQNDTGRTKDALFISEDTGTMGLDSALQLNPLAKNTFPDDYRKQKVYWKYTSYPDSIENTLTNQINALYGGLNFVTHYGHSSEVSLNHEMSASVTGMLTNAPYFPVYVSCGCHAGNFPYEAADSAGERLMTNADGGAIAYLGNANLGLGPIGGTAFIESFFTALFAGTTHIGDAMMTARETFYNSESSLNSETMGIRWTAFVVVLFGDPEMEVRIQDPGVLSVTHPAALAQGEQCLEVAAKLDGVPIAGATVTVYRNGAYLFAQPTDQSGQTTFRFDTQDTGAIQVTATYPQALPALSDVAVH